jgi:hypothetical protein
MDLELPGRRELESALGDLNEPWSGGPLSEPARKLLATNAAYVDDPLLTEQSCRQRAARAKSASTPRFSILPILSLNSSTPEIFGTSRS